MYLGAVATLCVLIYSVYLATFPGEWLKTHLPELRLIPTTKTGLVASSFCLRAAKTSVKWTTTKRLLEPACAEITKASSRSRKIRQNHCQPAASVGVICVWRCLALPICERPTLRARSCKAQRSMGRSCKARRSMGRSCKARGLLSAAARRVARWGAAARRVARWGAAARRVAINHRSAAAMRGGLGPSAASRISLRPIRATTKK